MSRHIPFNKPFIAGKELYYMAQAILGGRSSGDGPFTARCCQLIEKRLKCHHVLLTQSYASAMDMAAMLSQIGPGDEVIMPSFSFVSVANAFHMQGATPVFVDIRPDTLNLDETMVEKAVTDRTKVIVVPHYAGIGSRMKQILAIAEQHGLLVVEDAANGFGAVYPDYPEEKALGILGDLGVLSFHETNNIICGEGGALLINNPIFREKAEIIREKGTNRSKFFRGEVDKYTWVDIGSSFLPSDMVAAFLLAQLEITDQIISTRSRLFELYMQGLQELENKDLLLLPKVHGQKKSNSHIMYVIVRSKDERTRLIHHLGDHQVNAVFHYTPLHASPMGRRYGRTHGTMIQTIKVSERLVRLPLYYDMMIKDVEHVISAVKMFY